MKGRIHHVDIPAADLARSTEFYDRLLPLLGFRRIGDCDGNPVWAGEFAEVGLQPARETSRGAHDRYAPGLHHLAFAAPNRAAVDELHH
jgi:glyoxylase I family protein